MRVQRVSRGAHVVVAALLGGLLVAGCAGQPGAAAVVDGRSISVSDLDVAVREMAPATGPDATQRVLEWLVLAPVYRDAAASVGLGISDEEVTAFLNEAIGAAGGEVGELSEPTLQAGHYLLARHAIDQLPPGEGDDVVARVNEQVAALDIELSPRFGGAHAGSDAEWGQRPAWFVQP